MMPRRVVAIAVAALLSVEGLVPPQSESLTRRPPPLPVPSGGGASAEYPAPRRRFLLGGASAALSAAQLAFAPPASAASPAAAVSPPPPLVGRGGAPFGPRVEEIGGGFDVLSPSPSAITSPDAVYPASLLGTWRVRRRRTATEGDIGQAGVAWRLLGGRDDRAFARELDVTYDARFVEAPEGPGISDAGYSYSFEGRSMKGVILDRGHELASREGSLASNVRWDPARPDVLRYVDGFGEPVELAVVQRRIEPPSEAGFGSDELIRITASPGGLLGSAVGPVVRAVRVRRRYRRAYDDEGNRIVEGLEIVTTYRVLDGVAGVEMPTSTTKTRIRMTRQD